MSFTRTIEDFTCGHCGTHVTGDGYTNHCPCCLWSRHVDISPGDRAQSCGAMMEPVALEGSTPDYVIVHRCEKCGAVRRVRVSPADDPEAVVALAGKVRGK